MKRPTRPNLGKPAAKLRPPAPGADRPSQAGVKRKSQPTEPTQSAEALATKPKLPPQSAGSIKVTGFSVSATREATEPAVSEATTTPTRATAPKSAQVNTKLLDRLEQRESVMRLIRRKRLAVLGGVLVVIVAVSMVVFVSPLTAYRLTECRVTGMKNTDAAAICQATGGFAGTPLTRISTGVLRGTVLKNVPALREVQVQRRWWHGLSLRVQEREPVATVRKNGKVVGVDRDMVVLEVAPGEVSGLPQLNADLEKLGGKTRKLVDAALHTLGDMSPQLRSQIEAVTSQDAAQLAFSLRDGRELVWGDSQKSGVKTSVALLLLEQPNVKVVDVSIPERPSTR